MTTKEQLIEKYQKNYKEMRLEIPTGEIISDLESLQDTTEEREVENKQLKVWDVFQENAPSINIEEVITNLPIEDFTDWTTI